MLHIRLLGGFSIQNDATTLTGFHSERLQALLAYLILHRDAPITRQQLAYTFWADTSDAQARTNLRTLLARFRDALPNADDFLGTDTQTIQWRANADYSCDVVEFQTLTTDDGQQTADHGEFVQRLASGVQLYRGDLLPTCYDEWIVPAREILREKYHDALEQLRALYERERALPRALEIAQRLLQADTLREEAYQHVMRLQLAQGDRTGALRTYHACATMLRAEFGIEPAPETHALYLQLLRVEEQPERDNLAVRGQASLIGRETEWARLMETWNRVEQGQIHFVLLTGEAGIGKTRLAEDFVAWAARQEIVTLMARGYENTQSSAFAPIVEWLRHDAVRQDFKNLERATLVEISRVAPSLRAEFPDLPEPAPITEAWQRARLFDALAHALAGENSPRVLFLDDAQWCDAETLEWLQFFARANSAAPVLILACVRREEVDNAHPLTKWKLGLHRAQALTEIALSRLTELQTFALAAEWRQETFDETDAQDLYRETEGNPLFVIETLRAGMRTDDKQRTADDATTPLPPKIQTVIQHRLSQLSANARGLSDVASVLGREFSFEVLAQASGSELDALVRGLDELWRKQIVREHQRGDAYDFTHDKIRATTYEELSAARKQVLHLRAADALVNVYADNLDAWSGQIAQQYERARQSKQAIEFYLRAAEVAKRVFAVQDTIQFYQRALALFPRADERTAELNHALGDALLMAGKPQEARDVFDVAFASTPPANTRERAQLVTKRGSAWSSQRETRAALREYELAEKIQGEPSNSWRAQDWAVWIQRQLAFAETYYFTADNVANAQVLQRAQPLVKKNGTAHQQIQLLRALGRSRVRVERFVPSDTTLALSQEIVQACENFGDKIELASARFNLGFMHLWRNELEDAERELHIARASAEALHYSLSNVLCQVYLTIVHRKRGAIGLAKEYARASAKLAEQMDIQEYKSAAQANLGWIEWRAGNFQEAQDACLEALAKFNAPYPFHWFALGPLLGIALERAEWGAAIEYARAMLTPPQQLLPEHIAAGFARAIAFWDAGVTLRARQELEQIAADAKYLGYL